jgi:carbonic anhydrase
MPEFRVLAAVGPPKQNVSTYLLYIATSLHVKTSFRQENVRLVAADIKKKSPIIRKEVAAGKVKIVGGYYSISAGRVENVSF